MISLKITKSLVKVRTRMGRRLFISVVLVIFALLLQGSLVSASPTPPPPESLDVVAALTKWLWWPQSITKAGGPKVSESARVFTLVNYCKETIWPAITPGDSFNGGGFALKSRQSIVFTAPVAWVGRIWARTGCKFDSTGTGSCQTGACGTSLKCSASGKPPATLAEFTLADVDYYDVSLVDGFNIPMTVTPINGKGNCTVARCVKDLRSNCPSELAVKVNGKTVACRSACDVFNTDEYCCRGVYGNPVTCQPTTYSRTFKEACPTAYSYAYDDPTSIFTCSGADYVIQFCSAGNHSAVCSYHDHKLYCTTGKSEGSKLLIGKWSSVSLMLALPLALNLLMRF